ncbi:hypothetical protein [Morganella morganii IS15]|nr:hypothetical protein [Morganella morganii IS15]
MFLAFFSSESNSFCIRAGSPYCSIGWRTLGFRSVTRGFAAVSSLRSWLRLRALAIFSRLVCA